MITYSQSIFFLKFLANRVRRCAKELELNEAVKLAVDECILNNILSEFLRKNKAEVIAMSIFEYDKEEEERKLRKAEYEAGVAAGMKDGMKAGVADGISKGKILAKKDATSSLITLGLTVEQISSALKVDVETVKQWIDNE
jgi:predicted transposase YdaD